MKFYYFYFALIAAPAAWCSSLKGSKGILLEKDPGLRCHTEYDDVWEEKCSTLYEDKCTTVSKKECRTSLDHQCSVQNEEACGFTTTQKCSSIPIPKCGIVWEKSCSSAPVCQTLHEKQCSTIHRPKCHFQHEKICTQVKETVCKKDKGAIHEKGWPVKGVKGISQDVGPDVHSVFKRSSDKESLNLTSATPIATGSKLTAKEAYMIHKQSLLDLKKKVEDELAAIEREEASNSTDGDGVTNHKLSKRSRSAIVDLNPSRKQKKRSLETLKQQLYSEIQILEEGDFTGDIEQINEKRKKRSTQPEVEALDDKVYPKDPNNILAKRFSKEEKVKGHVGLKGQKECWDEPREKCTSIPKEVCETVAEEVCTDVPKQICEEVETCKDLPKKDCQIIYKEICATLPSRECHSEPREVCVDVPREICEDVPKEVCVPVPGKHCEKVVVKRPREVCLPPQKVRVLDAVPTPVHPDPSLELY